MAKSNAVYDRVTARIVEALENGTAPWRKGWTEGNEAAYGMPHNATNGRAYRGMNVWLLLLEADEHGYTSTGWITPKQAMANELDFKGQKTCEVVFWARNEKVDEDTGKVKRFMYCKSYRVLNLDQCKGDKSKLKGHKALEIPEEISEADDMQAALAEALSISIRHGGDRAYYNPTNDYIMLPPKDAFESEVGYRATMLHEGVHATGHGDRLDREFGKRFGDEAYAFEELVAELGCSYIQAALGINMELENHASYLANWLKVLKADHQAIFTAASKAQAAADLILEGLGIVAAPVYEESKAA